MIISDEKRNLRSAGRERAVTVSRTEGARGLRLAKQGRSGAVPLRVVHDRSIVVAPASCRARDDIAYRPKL